MAFPKGIKINIPILRIDNCTSCNCEIKVYSLTRFRKICKKCSNLNRYKEWVKKNPERKKEISRNWCKNHPEQHKESGRNWQANNKDKVCAKASRYRSRKLTPKWANQEKINEFYQKAAELTKKTGVKHEVDHIVPLKGENATGLHVESNLQIIPRSQNASKKNKVPDVRFIPRFKLEDKI